MFNVNKKIGLVGVVFGRSSEISVQIPYFTFLSTVQLPYKTSLRNIFAD